jgi:nitrite reductase (NADH) large subunit
MLKAELEARGIAVHLEANTAAVHGKGRVEALELADGRKLEADLVIVAAGIRPNVDLAQTADLAIGRGINVDDQLRSSRDGIFALGECAEHRGICYGLVEPAYEQARVLASHLAGQTSSYNGSVLATNLKVSGVNLFSAGDFLGTPGSEQIVLSDPGLRSYRKLVIRDDKLVGAVLFGDTADGLWYLDLIRSAAPIGAIRNDMMFGRALAERSAGLAKAA